MLKIKKIEKSARGNDYILCLFDEDDDISLSVETIMNFDLFSKDTLTKCELDEILEFEDYRKAFNKALSYLDRRAYFSVEIIEKLRRLDFDDESIKKVVRELSDMKILDDKYYAHNFISSQKELGRAMLINKFVKKGFSFSVTENFLRNSDFDEEKESVSFFERKIKSISKDLTREKRREKMARSMANRGFSYSLIYKQIEKIK